MSDTLDQKIRDLAEREGFGRTEILRRVPEATEWRIRKVLSEIRGRRARTVVGRQEIVGGLRPIRVEVPPFTRTKPITDTPYTLAVLSDIHAPFHSEEDLSVALQVLSHQIGIRLDRVVLAGDIGDFYSVSKYDKDPRRINQLQDELVVQSEILGQIAEASGDAARDYVNGNHEARLEGFISSNAPALASLKQLQLPNLLGLEGMGYTHHPTHVLVEGVFLVRHGHYVSGHAGYSAKRELEQAGISGASGHVHRLAVVERRDWIDEFTQTPPKVWVETGCLTRAPLHSYTKGNVMNWQQGFAIIQIYDDFIVPHLVRIHNGRAIYNGKVFDAQ